ncbi:MAG: uroporphyrinogen decarboxylase family protein [Sphaerochaetaceae bacterium]|nr:uroporphyrinogen decarboxylase family protein [Sphaerochaetaceae bacterium]
MTPRERILAVLDYSPTDRVPFDIWYTREVRDQLMTYFGVSDEIAVWDALELDKIVMVDAPYTQVNNPVYDERDRLLTFDEWKSGRRTVRHSYGGDYEEVVFFPLASARSKNEIEGYLWPDPTLFDYSELKNSCVKYARWTRMLTFVSLFEIYCKLRPFEQALMDLYIEPELADAIIRKIFEIQRQYIEQALRTCNGAIDVVYLSDDMGMQDRLLISEEVWEARFLEPYRDLIKLIHAHKARAFYHSDGAAFPILKRMIDLGIDIINPIQHTCPHMDRKHLIEAFSDRVVFHGAVENQRILPFGTTNQVRTEVRKNIDVLGTYGRYICAPCHNLQSGTPLENILSMYRCDRSW